MITLRPVDLDNWAACGRLELGDGQEQFVASNMATIAQSKFEPHFHLRAIYDDDLLVGMLAYCHEDELEDFQLYWIFRLMVDVAHQGNGFGFAAVRLAIGEIETLGAKRIRTMHKPSNTIASSLYEKLGFEHTGEILDDGDLVRELTLSKELNQQNKRMESDG